MITSRRALLVLALLFCAGLSACAGSPGHERAGFTPQVAGRSIDEWCAVLEPEAEARAWRAIPWQANFHAGLAVAADAQRPLLLWLMNGHPLGCT